MLGISALLISAVFAEDPVKVSRTEDGRAIVAFTIPLSDDEGSLDATFDFGATKGFLGPSLCLLILGIPWVAFIYENVSGFLHTCTEELPERNVFWNRSRADKRASVSTRDLYTGWIFWEHFGQREIGAIGLFTL